MAAGRTSTRCSGGTFQEPPVPHKCPAFSPHSRVLPPKTLHLVSLKTKPDGPSWSSSFPMSKPFFTNLNPFDFLEATSPLRNKTASQNAQDSAPESHLPKSFTSWTRSKTDPSTVPFSPPVASVASVSEDAVAFSPPVTFPVDAPKKREIPFYSALSGLLVDACSEFVARAVNDCIVLHSLPDLHTLTTIQCPGRVKHVHWMSSVTTETDDFSDIASQTDAKLVALLATGQLLCWNVSLASPHTTTHLFTTSLAWPLSGFAAVSSHSLLLVSHSTFTIVALDSMIQEDASSPRSHPIDVTLLTSLHSVGEPIQAFSVCSNIVCLFTQSRVLFTSLNGLAVTTLNSIQTFSPAGVRSLCHLPAAVPFFAFVKDSTFGLMKFAPPYMLLRGKFPGDVRHAFAARTADGTPVLLGYTVDMMYVVMIDENVLSANPRIRVASIPIPQGLLSLSVLHMDKTAIRVVAQSYSSFSVREFPLSFAYTFPLESEPLVITPAAWSSVGTLPSEPAALLNTFQQEAESVASHTHDAVALYVNTCISEQLKCAVLSAMNSLQTKSSVVSEQVQLQHSIQTQAVDETNIPVSSENSIESTSPSPTGSSVAVIEPDLTTESLPRPSSATETNDLALLDLDPVDAIVEFTLHPSPSAFSDLRDQIEPYLSKLSAPHLLSLMHVLSKLELDVDEDDDLSVLRVSCIVHAFFQFRALQVESKTLTDSLVQPVLQNIQANITQLGALGSARHQVKVKFAREVLEAALKTFE